MATVDRAGRPFTRSYESRPPANKGKRYPPNPPSGRDIYNAVATLGDSAQDRRLAATIAILWRAGLRLAEALALTAQDVDHDAHTITVRATRTAAKRRASMDTWGLERVARWQEVRATLPDGPLLCVVRGPTVGRNWTGPAVQSELRNLSATTGIKRLAPQQLRYAHAAELLGENVAPGEVYRQLGLSTARNNRAAAIVSFDGSRTAADALKPPAGDQAVARARGTASGEAYSLVRRAAQAVDNGRSQASTREARRAYDQALQALHVAEEKVMHALAEDYGYEQPERRAG